MHVYEIRNPPKNSVVSHHEVVERHDFLGKCGNGGVGQVYKPLGVEGSLKLPV